MSQNFLETLRGDREARTVHQSHGLGILTLVDDKPVRASGCLLPDGALVDAVCLAGSAGAQVWSRPIEGPRRRRRGRLIIEPGTALRFVDEPQADVPQKAYAPGADLARDLALSARIRACVQNDLFAGLLYAALCATKWRHCDAKATWSCSWRAAGGVVAGLRGDGDYPTWYCWGHEETLDEAVLLNSTRSAGAPSSHEETDRIAFHPT
jgi:hypothetical protein